MRKRFLVLDDDNDLLDSLADLLGALGAPSLTVRSLDELKAARNEALTTELAILNLYLGPNEPTGIDAFEWLRASGYSGDIVFLTGHRAGHPLVKQAGATSSTRLLFKPIGLEELRTLLVKR